jgi:hypothetical protein
MSDKIIDITSYLDRGEKLAGAPAMMALWGVDGERSRFALPLWRIVHLARAERGVIFWRNRSGDPRPFVAVDLSHDPARLTIDSGALPPCEDSTMAGLHDQGRDGLLVCLGARGDRSWYLVADGGTRREGALEARTREDVLFLAGECAGLLFLRDFADSLDEGDGV